MPQGLHEKGPITLGKLKIFIRNRSSCINYPAATFFATEPFQLKKNAARTAHEHKILIKEESSSLDVLEGTVIIMGIFLYS